MPELTPEQQTTAKLVAKEHRELQNQLMELNRDLDDHLGHRGQGLSRVQPIVKTNAQTQADKIAARNDELRRKNEDLARQLVVVDALAKTDDLRQKYNLLSLQCENLRNENKSLENVYANQQVQIVVADKVENEMKRAKQEHNEELGKLKDAARQLKESRESEMDGCRQLQKQETRIDARLKLQDDHDESASVQDLEKAVADRDEAIETIKEQILQLSKASTTKARNRSMNDKKAKELDDLRSEYELLKEKLEAAKISVELDE